MEILDFKLILLELNSNFKNRNMQNNTDDYDRLNDGNSKFYDFQNAFEIDKFIEKDSMNLDGNNEFQKIFKLIRESEIGNNRVFSGAFSFRKSIVFYPSINFDIINYWNLFFFLKLFIQIIERVGNH